MLNATQRAIVISGVIVAGLMALFPPYFDMGGLFGGVQFAFVLRPPEPDYAIDLRPAVAWETLLLQWSATACFTLAAVIATGKRGSRAPLWAVNTAAFVATVYAGTFMAYSAAIPGRGWTAAPFLICLIPIQFPGGYFLFWLRLASLALITLLSAYAASHRSASLAWNSLVMAVSATAFGLICLAAAKAALR